MTKQLPCPPVEVENDNDTAGCFGAMQELRPHLVPETFLPRIRAQRAQGYRLAAIRDGAEFVAVVGFRICDFLAWGKTLYVDDLSTMSRARKKGYGAALLRYVIEVATEAGCDAVHLDTGYHRIDAHKLYLNLGFELSCHHLALRLPGRPY